MDIYLLFLLLLLLFGNVFSLTNEHEKNIRILSYYNFLFCIVSAILIIYLISMRDLVMDSQRYYWLFNDVCGNNEVNTSLIFKFINIMFCNLGFNYLLMFVPLLYIFCSLIYCEKNGLYYSGILFLLVISSLPFFQYTASGLRQSISISFILILQLMLLKSNRNIFIFLISIVAILSHKSSVVFVLPLILLHFFYNKSDHKKRIFLSMFYIWLSTALLSFLGFFELIKPVFTIFIDDSYINSTYFSDNDFGYKTGFRLDFLGYSLFPFAFYLGTYLIGKFTLPILSDSSKKLIMCYLLFNSIANVFNWMPYSDRWYGYSWSIGPLIIIYHFKDVDLFYGFSYVRFLFFILLTIAYSVVAFLYNSKFIYSNVLFY